LSLPSESPEEKPVTRWGYPRTEHLPTLARSLVADIADIAEESGTDARWFPDLDSDELDVVVSLWRGDSMRRLRVDRRTHRPKPRTIREAVMIERHTSDPIEARSN
jgi:hypothetical protein